MEAIHTIEHAADMEKHELLNTLIKAFITPIDREDIILLSQNIDDLTDNIEDVLIRIYYNNIRTIHPDALELMRIVCRCCEAVKVMMEEFADFRQKASRTDHQDQLNGGGSRQGLHRQYAQASHKLH